MQSHTDMTALGVHCFAGPFTWGLRQNGIDVIAQLEESEFGVETSKYNNPGLHAETQRERWLPFLDTIDKEIGAVFGHPACSCWSPMGRSYQRRLENGSGKDSWRTDPNLQQTVDLVTMGDIVRPRMVITESVPQFEDYGAAGSIAQFWKDRGYSTTIVRLDAKFFGLPQQRRRVFLIAHKQPMTFEFPEFSGLQPVGAVLEGDIVKDIKTEADPHYEDLNVLLDQAAPGDGLRKYMPNDWSGKRPRFVDHRIHWYQPTSTITGNSIHWHPFENRKLSWREAALLCGYPEDWEVIASKPVLALGQLAKAVMPPVAKWLGEQLVRSWNESDLDEPHHRRITHWAKSRRLIDDRVQFYTDDIDFQDSDWLETRVAETREALEK